MEREKRMDDKPTQDVWRVTIVHMTNERAGHHQRGFLVCPYPMTAFEAVDQGVRREVAEIAKMESYLPNEIHVTAWRSRSKGRQRGIEHACAALASLDKDTGQYLRHEPWVADSHRVPVLETVNGIDLLDVEWT
jgi:hypothetical protein